MVQALQSQVLTKPDESTLGVSAQFSCGFCNKTYKSRVELKQHTTQEHSKNE